MNAEPELQSGSSRHTQSDASNCDLHDRCKEFCDGLPPVLSLWQLQQVMAVGKLLPALTLWRSTQYTVGFASQRNLPCSRSPLAAIKERLDVEATSG